MSRPDSMAARAEILYVLPKPDFFSQGRRGRVTHALGVARGLAEAGVPVHVLSGPGLAIYEEELGPGVTLESVPVPEGSASVVSWNMRLRTHIDRALGTIAHPRFVVVRYAVSNAFMFPTLMKRHRDRFWVFEVNSLAYHQYHALPSLVRRILLRYERGVLRAADAASVVSLKLRADLVSGRGGLRGDRVLAVPNAGPEALAEMAAAAPVPPGAGQPVPVRFAYLGIFQEYYDFDLVLDAFLAVKTEHPSVELHLYGDGPRMEAVRRRAMGQEQVVFHGRYDLRALVRSGKLDTNTVLLLPYRQAPLSGVGSPTKLFEYMALGRPILASRVGQLPDVLQHGETAYLYAAGDRDSLARGMRWMVEQPEQRLALGSKACRTFMEHHTWKQRMSAFHQELTRLAGGPVPREESP